MTCSWWLLRDTRRVYVTYESIGEVVPNTRRPDASRCQRRRDLRSPRTSLIQSPTGPRACDSGVDEVSVVAQHPSQREQHTIQHPPFEAVTNGTWRRGWRVDDDTDGTQHYLQKAARVGGRPQGDSERKLAVWAITRDPLTCSAVTGFWVAGHSRPNRAVAVAFTLKWTWCERWRQSPGVLARHTRVRDVTFR